MEYCLQNPSMGSRTVIQKCRSFRGFRGARAFGAGPAGETPWRWVHTSVSLISLNLGVFHTYKVTYELGVKKKRNKAITRAVSFQPHKQVIRSWLEVTIALSSYDKFLYY